MYMCVDCEVHGANRCGVVLRRERKHRLSIAKKVQHENTYAP